MKVICAYLLAALGGNASPAASDLQDILSSVGAEADDADIAKLLGELEGKDLAEVIALGTAKLAAVPSGGGVGGVVVATTAAVTGDGGGSADTKKPEAETPEEDDDDEDDGMEFNLFD